MAKSKPTVFIGSSHESLDVVDIIAKALKDDASVRPWTDTDLFPAGEFLLNSLLRQAQSFDFALMVFGPDDIVLSGDDKVSVPRDNVVFELGLFMSQLEHDRALVVVPKTYENEQGIKILTDLGGLKTVDYKRPTSQDREALVRALRAPIKQIRKRIKDMGPKRVPPAVVDQGPRDLLEVASAIRKLCEQAWERGQVATIRNIALDMDATWGMICRLIDNANVRDLDWQTVMINPASRAIKKVEGSTVSTKLAGERIRHIRKTCLDRKEELADRNVHFECRGYSTVPVVHGFLVNASVLLLTITRIEKGELIGAPNAYLKFVNNPGQETIDHAFKAFSNWFDQLWAKGSDIWPIKSAQ